MLMIDKRINYHIKKYGFKPEVVIVTNSEIFEMKQQAIPIHEVYFSPLKSEEIYAIAMHEFVCLWDGVKVFRHLSGEIPMSLPFNETAIARRSDMDERYCAKLSKQNPYDEIDKVFHNENE